MPNTIKKGTKLVKRGAAAVKKSRVSKLAKQGRKAAMEAYDTVKATVARVKRRRAVKRAAETTMKVAGEAAKVAAITGAVAAAVAIAREVRKR